MNRIRKVLSEIDGITLEFVNRHWIIKKSNEVKCDYEDYIMFKESHKINGDLLTDIHSFLEIVKGGEFLKEISYIWLDAIKITVSSEIIKLLKKKLITEQVKNDVELQLQISNSILSFDSLDQDAIKYKVKLLFLSGEQHAAKNSYDLFLAEYEQTYGEKYSLTFQELVAN